MRITEWHGDELSAKIRRASVAAINETTEEAARDASQDHWWSNRSGDLQSEIVNEGAEPTARGAKGRFGSTKGRGFYGLILEHRNPFLRPSGDRNFPHLAKRIQRRLG